MKRMTHKVMKLIIGSLLKKRATDDSAFSVFIREASPKEKKKVYRRVLERATERQIDLLRKAG